MRICQHFNSLKKQNLSNLLHNSKHTCSNIQKHKQQKQNLWMCLTCGNIGCSRNSQKKCAQKHSKQKKHKIFGSLKSGELFCYQCDQNINDIISICQQNDNSPNDAKKLERLIEFKQFYEAIFIKCIKKSSMIIQFEQKKKQQSVYQIKQQQMKQQKKYTSKVQNVKLNVFGLSNLGNTCFFNSIMQCLYASKILYQTYITLDFTRLSNLKEPKLYIQQKYSQLSQQDMIKSSKIINYTTTINQKYRKFLIQTQKANTFSPNQMFSSIGSAKSKFKSMAQQDAQQLLRYLLDAMNQGQISFLGINRQYLRCVQKKFGRKKLTYIENIFGSYLASRLFCLNCKKISWTLDLSLDLNIQIVKSKSQYIQMPVGIEIPKQQIKQEGLFYPDKSKKVFQLFQAFFSPQTLTKANYFSCETCKASKAIKKLYIKDPPEILTIVIKRFTNGLMKNASFVEFPKILDISGVSLNKGKWEYEIYGVVVHQGGVGGGHYICYTKRNDDWYYFSDSHFKKTNWQNVKSSQAYILFYEKIL